MNAVFEKPLIAGYPITRDDIQEFVNAVELLDWTKNCLPDESPEKAEAAVKVASCHAVIERVLGNDASSVYGPADPEEETHL